MRKLFAKNSERGDTIIEVLIAVAVVSSVLAISYSVMNRNLLILRNNQERTEASKLAQAQIERLKAAWKTADPASFPGPSESRSFCMAPGVTFGFGGTAPTSGVFEDFPEECIDTFYYVGITYDSGEDRYLVRVQWDSISEGRSEVVMAYKLQ